MFYQEPTAAIQLKNTVPNASLVCLRSITHSCFRDGLPSWKVWWALLLPLKEWKENHLLQEYHKPKFHVSRKDNGKTEHTCWVQRDEEHICPGLNSVGCPAGELDVFALRTRISTPGDKTGRQFSAWQTLLCSFTTMLYWGEPVSLFCAVFAERRLTL